MLVIYKGYEKEFLERKNNSLNNTNLEEKFIIKEPEKTAQNIVKQFTLLNEKLKENDYWITYEEFSTCYKILIPLIETFGIETIISINNKYFDIYPLEIYDKKYIDELIAEQEEKSDKNNNIFYSYIYKINDKYYVQYCNYEYDFGQLIKTENRYNSLNYNIKENDDVDYIFEINDDVEKYLMQIVNIDNYSNIGITIDIDNKRTQRMFHNLVDYLLSSGKNAYMYLNKEETINRELEYIRIAKEEIGIPGFKEFKKIKVYSNPGLNNETKIITQNEIINAITREIDKSKDNIRNNYRDIFVTAPTGAGKSIMFQIPAVYAANKYKSLTIVISPLVELMNDQVENLKERGYEKAERINSDINVIERQDIINRISNNNIDILYISPEALLSYSIESIIGDREISMIVVDEAHIVTTWGQGFRPDYWYLGAFIDKLRKEKSNKIFKKYDFPICTFTATAVYGGKDDGVLEISKSLYLKDPIQFIGEVRRNDIKFDININDENMNKSETDIKKAQKLYDRLKTWINKDEKSLVYFPFNSICQDAFNARESFAQLSELKDNLAIYTGKTNKDVKRYAVKEYKNNNKKIMLATKAFGMGIDIKDIVNVYHYAISGNFNDYIQEIGRAARDENIIGIAHLDFFKRDVNYSKILFGMSAIKQYHIDGILRVINNIYKKHNRRNNLITPQAFESIFPNADDLENTVKTALLNLEKDLYAKYNMKVISTRPRTLFTSAYAVIDREIADEFKKSKFFKYFEKESEGRNKEFDRYSYISDMGDIYQVNLKGIWESEKEFNNLSFAQFKYNFYSEREKIFGDFAKNICPRNKIVISTFKDNDTLYGIKEKLLNEVKIVNDILTKYRLNDEMFTISQFRHELKEAYKDRENGAVLADSVANGYLKAIEDNTAVIQNKFYARYSFGEATKYKILSSNYRNISESLIYKSPLLKQINYCDKNVITKYKSSNDSTIKPILKILNLLSLFGLAQYDIYGGMNPEIYIRINDPYRIENIVSGKIFYENNIVKEAREKHDRDIKVLKKFIYDLKSDDERWDYIEKYFLGEDVIGDEENPKS